MYGNILKSFERNGELAELIESVLNDRPMNEHVLAFETEFKAVQRADQSHIHVIEPLTKLEFLTGLLWLQTIKDFTQHPNFLSFIPAELAVRITPGSPSSLAGSLTNELWEHPDWMEEVLNLLRRLESNSIGWIKFERLISRLPDRSVL